MAVDCQQLTHSSCNVNTLQGHETTVLNRTVRKLGEHKQVHTVFM